MIKSIPYYQFCDDLDAPDLVVVMNKDWYDKHRDEIRNTEGVTAMQALMFLIPKEEDRALFVLRFDPWQNS